MDFNHCKFLSIKLIIVSYLIGISVIELLTNDNAQHALYNRMKKKKRKFSVVLEVKGVEPEGFQTALENKLI